MPYYMFAKPEGWTELDNQSAFAAYDAEVIRDNKGPTAMGAHRKIALRADLMVKYIARAKWDGPIDHALVIFPNGDQCEVRCADRRPTEVGYFKKFKRS